MGWTLDIFRKDPVTSSLATTGYEFAAAFKVEAR